MHRRRIVWAVLALDLAWIVLALGLSHAVRYATLHRASVHMYWVVAVTGTTTWALLFRTMQLDGIHVGWRKRALAGRVVLATVLLMACILSVAYLDELYYSRLLLACFTLLLLLGFLLVRSGVYWFLCSRFHHGLVSRVVLVGENPIARELAFKVVRHPELLYEVVGTLNPFAVEGGDAKAESATELRSSIEVLDDLRQRRVDEIIIVQHTPGSEFQTFVERCREAGMRVSVLPHGYELYMTKPQLIEIDGLPLISLQSPDGFPYATVIKRAMDLSLTAVLALPAMVIGTCVALVLWRRTGSAFRREVRIGKNGKSFWMHRLNIDREGDNGPAFDRWVRTLSISELPQLWNVVRGEMTLVGPRPEEPERVIHYSDWQRARLKAVPGITGLAQVNGLRDQHSSEYKTRFDLQYLLEWSPVLDFVLLMQTISTLAKRCFRKKQHLAEVIQMPSREQPAPFGSTADVLPKVAHADRA